MRSWSRKALLWQGVGILCYLAGLLVFVSVVIGVFLAPPQNSLANLSSGHVPILIASVALIVAGRLISYKYGVQNGLSGAVREYHGRPEKSKLEELGYVIPPENEGTKAASSGNSRSKRANSPSPATSAAPRTTPTTASVATARRNCRTDLWRSFRAPAQGRYRSAWAGQNSGSRSCASTTPGCRCGLARRQPDSSQKSSPVAR